MRRRIDHLRPLPMFSATMDASALGASSSYELDMAEPFPLFPRCELRVEPNTQCCRSPEGHLVSHRAPDPTPACP